MGGRDLTGARVLVAGGRVTGVAAARAMLGRGAVVTVTDADPAQLATVDLPGVVLEAGLETAPAGTDLVVTSPGFRPDSPLLVAAARDGIDVIGDVELAWWLDQDRPGGPGRWLVITGTNGKTTTVGMLESMLDAAGVDAVACGNVGLPVVDAVAAGHDVLAVELSSFQLHWSRSLRPHAAVVLNVAPDHLDWHGSMPAYTQAKAKAYAPGTVAVVNEDEPAAAALASGPERIGFTTGPPAAGFGVRDGVLVDPGGHPIVAAGEIRPPGPHNIANALAAAALAGTVGVGPVDAAAGLRAFTPAGHRSALVAEHDGVRWIDDSKATNPHATRAALLAHPRVVWIAGGLLKGADVDELVAGTASRLVGAVLIGTDRHQIAAALARHAPDLPVQVVDSGNHKAMVEAVAAASGMARPGDVVLLAPAAASLDMFTDYKHRGRAFADAVHALGSTDARAGKPPFGDES